MGAAGEGAQNKLTKNIFNQRPRPRNVSLIQFAE